MGHRFFVVDPADGFGQEDGDVDRLDLVALQLLQVVGDGVSHHNLKIIKPDHLRVHF